MSELSPPELNQQPDLVDNAPSKLARLAATGIAAAAILVSPTNEQPAYADTPQAVIGMPFDGKWAYSNPTAAACGPGSNQTSHPSCHEVYFGDWSTDLYGAAGTAVKLNVSGDALSFTWDTTASGSCGQTRRLNVFAGGAKVGRVHYTHLSEAAPIANTPTNGMTIGKIANLSCNPGGSGKHIHIEFDNIVAGHSCYVAHSNANYSAGISVSEGNSIGVLGSSNIGTKQACMSIPSSTPPAINTEPGADINNDGNDDLLLLTRLGRSHRR